MKSKSNCSPAKTLKSCEVCEKPESAYKRVQLTKGQPKVWLCKSCVEPVPRALLVMTEQRRNQMYDDLIAIFNITDKYTSL